MIIIIPDKNALDAPLTLDEIAPQKAPVQMAFQLNSIRCVGKRYIC
jgi:hypothetical protein